MIKINGKEIEFKTFPNGETLMNHESIEEHFDLDEMAIDFKYENDSDLIKLMFVKKYLDRHYVGDIFLLIYYMPYSRMDRVEKDSPFTLKYVAEFINDLKFYHVNVTEPHSDVTCALLDNSDADYINFNLLPEVMNIVEFDKAIDYIVFPDAGASKRYGKLKNLNILVGHKHRDFQTGEIKSLELIGKMNYHGTKAIIVDDLSSYGGTFVRTAQSLRKQSVKEIYLLVAHAENSIFKGELFNHVNKVFTTDSILTEQNAWHNKIYSEQLHIFEIEGELSND